jgi:AP-3 complex subunit sigma
MILAVLVVNDAGQARLVRWYEPVQDPASLLRRVFLAISRRGDRLCNFLDAEETGAWKKGTKLVYRHYATLYFIFVCEETESELGILDLIQVFVETLDRCFESVCELDLIFHADRVHYVLDEMVQGGLVLETNMSAVLKAVDDMARLERSTLPSSTPAAASIATAAVASLSPATNSVVQAGQMAATTLAVKAQSWLRST